jgi:hypothetical protein
VLNSHVRFGLGAVIRRVSHERQLRAVHVGQIETVQQDCRDAENGRKEPTLLIFCVAAEVRFR